jgi:succinyl-CoA synthetase alpha subunit
MRVIVQGITGREASNFVKDSLDYGMDIVAGVVPGKRGTAVHGVDVYNCISEIPHKDDIDCSVISVPAAFVKDAALEAIDSGIKLVVIVSERIPRRDVVEVLSAARERGARVVGPNTLGIISPEESKIGMIGGRVEDVRKSYRKGCIGVMSRSGGMTTEIANLLTCNGFGQSTCVSVGGDPIVGSDFVDLLPLFCEDAETKAVVLYSEPGGSAEERLADYVTQNGVKLPIVAFLAGRFVDDMEGVRFGHAGSIVEKGKGTTRAKKERLLEAGVHVADGLGDIPGILNSVLG